MEQSDQQLSQGNFSDEEPDPEEIQLQEQLEPKAVDFDKSIAGSIEIIYTLFTLYRKELNQIAQKYLCKIKFTISTVIVESAKGVQKQRQDECRRKAQSFMKSINMVEINSFSQENDKKRFIGSPYIQEQLQKKKIRLVYFQKKLFGVSRELPKELLKKELVTIVKSIIIFSLCLKRIRKEQGYFHQIYSHVVQFMKSIFVYYQKFFNERNVVVRLNKTGSFIMLHGSKMKYLMECKFTIKNVIESMVCLFIKDSPIDHKILKKYLAKASIFPVYFAKYNNSNTVIISKDNVLRQLIQKSPNFLKYLGIQPQNGQKLNYEPQVGFHIVPSTSLITKLQNIRQKLQSKCYDLQSFGGVRYMTRIYRQKGEQPADLLRELMIQVIYCIEQHKIKFQVIKELRLQPAQQKIVQVDDGLKYQVVSGKQQEKQLSQLLRRDVLYQKVQMKKKYLIAYNVLEISEQVAYWMMNNEGQQLQEVKVEELGKGKYMKGLKKIDGKGGAVKLYEQLLTVL